MASYCVSHRACSNDGKKHLLESQTCIKYSIYMFLYSTSSSASYHRESLVELDLLVPLEPVAPLVTLACLV